MKLRKLLYAFIICALIFTACDSDNDEILPVLSQGSTHNLELGGSIILNPKIDSENHENIIYTWKINNEVVSTDATYTFKADKLGEYLIQFEATGGGSIKYDYLINVYNIRKSNDESSPYLSSIIEFKPAPGQFVNEKGYSNPKDILGKPEYTMISLGGFGGYVSATFDHTILNRQGKEIIIFGNPMEKWSEPGIVMVSFDFNGNGKADDDWYELAGSDYNSKETIHNYEITYTNPKKEYTEVSWTDNQGNSGVIKTNEWHTDHNYYPEFINEQESVTFKGTLLSNNVYEDLKNPNGHGTGMIEIPSRAWGYVDNYTSTHETLKGNTFDIEWAVDRKGNKVKLPGVDFIKIYTAMNADAKVCGEVSTEILGAADLLLLE